MIAGMREDTATGAREESSAAGRPGDTRHATMGKKRAGRWVNRRRHCAGNEEHYPLARYRPLGSEWATWKRAGCFSSVFRVVTPTEGGSAARANRRKETILLLDSMGTF